MVGALIAALRPIIAVALVGGAATALVAPAFDMAMQQRGSQAHSAGAAPSRHDPTPTPNPDDPNAAPEMDFETLVHMCLDSRDPDSDACAAAAEKSGMSYEDFRAKVAAKLEGDKPKPEAKKNTEDFWAVFDKCLDTRDWRSDVCVGAQELIGFNDEDFHAKFARYLAERDAKNNPAPAVVKKTEPTKQPEPVKKPSTTNDFGTWFEKCLATRNFDSDECIRAEELSGLSTAEFEAKFKAKLAAKDGSDFWTVFDKCLATRDWRSDLCVRAQELIGFSDADFHAKFDRYLAERDAKTPPVVAPKPTTNPYAVFVACGMTHQWSSASCLEALAKSGLGQTEFRAKMTSTFGEFH